MERDGRHTFCDFSGTRGRAAATRCLTGRCDANAGRRAARLWMRPSRLAAPQDLTHGTLGETIEPLCANLRGCLLGSPNE